MSASSGRGPRVADNRSMIRRHVARLCAMIALAALAGCASKVNAPGGSGAPAR
jgi:hypothetical protein